MCLQSSCLVSFTFGGNSDNVETLCLVARLGDDTMGAAVQQIADWLEKLGMSEYAQRFAENGINVAALPHLTDQDLKDIGVLLGHRRVMLAAVSKLAGAAARSAHGTSSESDQSRFALDRLSVNERKQRCGNIQSGIPADVLFGVTAGVATSAGRGFGSGGDGAARW